MLLTIASLSFVTAYPALSWLAAAPTFGKLLAVQMMFSFYFGVYSGAMLGCLVEIVPAHVRTTCFSIAFALAAGMFGTATPFVATKLIAMTDQRQGLAGLLADVRRGARHHRRLDRLSRRQDHRDARGRHRIAVCAPRAMQSRGRPICISMQTR